MKPALKASMFRVQSSLLSLALFSPMTFAQRRATVPSNSASSLSLAERNAAAQLKTATIREVTRILTSKEMEGRGTAQPGADRAAKYLAERFASAGLNAGGDSSSYLQQIKFKTETMLPESSFKVTGTVFNFKNDFVILPPFPSTAHDATGGLVLVGFGVVSDELKRDDLAGIDVKGKIVMVLSGKPKTVEDEAWNKAADEETVFSRLILKGAAGFVVTQEVEEATKPFSVAAAQLRQVYLADAPKSMFNIPPIVLVSNRTAEEMFARLGTSFAKVKKNAVAGEFVSRDLKVQASISPRVKREEGTSNNVIGVIEGSDERLKSEAVVYTAHYDGFGIDYEGTVYPGAADNALGVGKLIAMAEVFAGMAPRPRRSIIFIATTGEEYRMLGAEYWLKHPTWPIEKVAANINYDGIGTESWGKLGFIINLGFDHSDMSEAVARVAAALRVKIVPDQWPELEILYDSDHYQFFKKGIPALFLLGGPVGNQKVIFKRAEKWMISHHHRPTDKVQPSWHWTGAQTLAVLGLIIGMRIANQDAMPAWKSDSPYNRPRGTDLPPLEQ